MQILGYIISLVMLVLFIMGLIKIFQDKQKKGVLHGILCIVTCGIWFLIWGWMNATRLGIKNIMLGYTICWVISIALNGMAMSSAMGG